LLQFFHAHYDQSDSLIQVAKFQERSLRRRNDALDLVEKIREEVEDEQKEQSTKDIKEIPDQEDIQTEESKEETA
jgi:Ran GTPase-activating protein (RanGAP) involved in mRNA processing and transport